jgi:hypothetical protein
MGQEKDWWVFKRDIPQKPEGKKGFMAVKNKIRKNISVSLKPRGLAILGCFLGPLGGEGKEISLPPEDGALMTSANMTQITDQAPLEIWSHIFNHLSFEEAQHARSTCRLFEDFFHLWLQVHSKGFISSMEGPFSPKDKKKRHMA